MSTSISRLRYIDDWTIIPDDWSEKDAFMHLCSKGDVLLLCHDPFFLELFNNLNLNNCSGSLHVLRLDQRRIYCLAISALSEREEGVIKKVTQLFEQAVESKKDELLDKSQEEKKLILCCIPVNAKVDESEKEGLLENSQEERGFCSFCTKAGVKVDAPELFEEDNIEDNIKVMRYIYEKFEDESDFLKLDKNDLQGDETACIVESLTGEFSNLKFEEFDGQSREEAEKTLNELGIKTYLLQVSLKMDHSTLPEVDKTLKATDSSKSTLSTSSTSSSSSSSSTSSNLSVLSSTTNASSSSSINAHPPKVTRKLIATNRLQRTESDSKSTASADLEEYKFPEDDL